MARLLFIIALALSAFTALSLTDVCANLHTELVVPDHQGILTPVGFINQCLCISQVPIFLQTTNVGILAVITAGQGVATTILNQLIFTSGLQCNYPPNSIPQCLPSDPCGFFCLPGFTFNPTNGQCVLNPSMVPRSPIRSFNLQRDCPAGLTACRSSFARPNKIWDCVDVQSDLDNCGGCVDPLDDFSPLGVDCYSIAGISDVDCIHGTCIVSECLPGWKRVANRRSCQRIN